MDDPVKSARSALTRAELPGMSLIEHLEELRKRAVIADECVGGRVVALDRLHKRRIALRLRHDLQGFPQVQARGDAPSQLGQQLSGLGVTHPGCPRDPPVRTMQP